MNNSLEIWGLRLELIGLVVVLIVTSWQVIVTDFFETQHNAWKNSIQRDVNITILGSLIDISNQIATNDDNSKITASNLVRERNYDVLNTTIDESDSLEEWTNKEQYSFFMSIKGTLFILGALLFVVGKFLILKHKTSQAG